MSFSKISLNRYAPCKYTEDDGYQYKKNQITFDRCDVKELTH